MRALAAIVLNIAMPIIGTAAYCVVASLYLAVVISMRIRIWEQRFARGE